MTHDHDDFETEPVRGLPQRLPPGEEILWQGTPHWRTLARRAMRLRPLALYAAVFVIWRGVTAVYDGGAVMDGLIGAALLASVFALALGLLASIAYFSARETVYTITNKRLVMRFGVALTMTVQIPFTKIASAGLRTYGDGTGDIPVSLIETERVSYVVMWPHVRPWRIRRPEPMLRCIKDAAAVADILAQALQTDLAETDKPADARTEPHASVPPLAAVAG